MPPTSNMYIPKYLISTPSSSAAVPCHEGTGTGPHQADATPSSHSTIQKLWGWLLGILEHANADDIHSSLTKRRVFNGDKAHDLNVTIGIVVGVLLGVFFIGLIAFFWFFGHSIRFTEKRRRRRRRKSGGSKSSRSSKSSKSSSGSDTGPPPPPVAPPASPPPPADG